MPEELWQQTQRMASAWLLLAGVIGGLGGLAWWRNQQPLSWQPRRNRWHTLDVPLLLLMGFLLPMLCAAALKDASWWKPDPTQLPSPLFEQLGSIIGSPAAAQISQSFQEQHTLFLWAKIIAVPLLAALLGLLLHLTDRPWPTLRSMPGLGQVVLTACLWILTTPLVLATNFGCIWVLQQLGQAPQMHPLTRIGTGTGLANQLLFIVSVCVFTPVLEEFIFRGVLTPWATQSRRYPWLLIGASAAVCLLPGLTAGVEIGPLMFVILTALGLLLLQQFGHWGRLPGRSTAAIWSSAALFGAIHISVWPTPIPLFVLGLPLGYLALRTGSWISCAAFHGLFNGISTLYLLLGG